MRYTLQNDELVHQVRFFAYSGIIFVSCNCRKQINYNHVSYEPINESHCLERARKLYNDPANHWEPFNEEDYAKW